MCQPTRTADGWIILLFTVVWLLGILYGRYLQIESDLYIHRLELKPKTWTEKDGIEWSCNATLRKGPIVWSCTYF